jgi:nitronate monooxygenase
MFGIEYPIVCGGLQWLSKAGLVSAVANAGGLGMLSAASHPDKASLLAEIRKTRELTDQPFGVNVSMLPGKEHAARTEMFMEAVIESGITIVETSGSSPEEYIPRLHDSGVKLIHKVPAVRFAKKAERAGADAITIVGFECGGHPGLDDVTTMALVPRAVDELTVPVLAGGGVADARGFVAMMALGADAVVMGTRFVLSEECDIHPDFKRRLLEAGETDTVMIQYSIRNPVRALKNRAAGKVAAMESRGATLQEILTVSNGQNGRRCWYEGNFEDGIHAVGQCIGQIDEIKPVAVIIKEIMQGAEDILARLQANIACR